MAIYFGTTEITNIDNLVPQTGLDITDLWFGSTNVYTVWETYEGTLPATLNANGSDMKQYQVWGNTGGVGDKTENLFDKDITEGIEDNYYISKTTGDKVRDAQYCISAPITVKSEETYYWFFRITSGGALHTVPTVGFFDANDNQIGVASHGTGVIYFPFTTPANCAYIKASVYKEDFNEAMLTEGSTAPASYVPFGYEVDMGVKSGNLFDYSDYIAGYYISSRGVETQSSQSPAGLSIRLNHSSYISVSPDESYTISAHHQNMPGPQTVDIAWYDDSKIFILRDSTLIPQKNAGLYSFTAMAPQNAKFAIFNFFTDDVQKVMFTPGTTPPDEYQPYSNTVIPVYIGDEPLDKDEYVNYTEQKVYRRTVNLFDKTIAVYQKYLITDGSLVSSSAWGITNYINVAPNTAYFIKNAVGENPCYCIYDNDKNLILGEKYNNRQDVTFVTGSNAAYVRMSLVYNSEDGRYNFDKLGLFRNTPTDPPVPLPALPTCEGTTIVDFMGQSVAPEKVLLKYRKEGF